MTTQTAIHVTNRAGLPDAIVRAIEHDGYSRGDADISTTQLIDPPRKVALTEAHYSELTEDASDRIWSLIGQAVHTILERADRAALAERLSMTVTTDLGTWKLSGHTDSITVNPQSDAWEITDYKLTSAYVLTHPRPEWDAQLNVYAELLRQQGFKVSSVRIVAILRDWSKLEAARDLSYPQTQVATVYVPLWSQDTTLAYIHDRVRLHQQARVDLPDCTPEERWQKSDTYAVMKPGRKSALRVLPTEAEALSWMTANAPANGAQIVKRPGEAIRCVHYCIAAPVCSFAQALKEELPW